MLISFKKCQNRSVTACFPAADILGPSNFLSHLV